MKTAVQIRQEQSGASLMELMFAMAISSIALISIVTFVTRSRGSLSRLEATSELTSANQRISQNLRAGLGGALGFVADYSGSPDFSGVHSMIVASINASATAPKIVSFSAQPVVQNATDADLSGGMAADVGNELFYFSTLSPITFTVYLTGTALVVGTPVPSTSQGYVVSVDRMQFVAVYLTQTKTSLHNGKPALRLVEWRSAPYATLASISSSSQGYLTGTCQAMVAAGYNIAVNTDYVTDTAHSYYAVSATGTLTGGPAPTALSESSWAYVDEFNLSQTYSIQANKDWGRVRGPSSAPGIVAPETLSFAYNNLSSVAVPTPVANYITANRSSGPMLVPAFATIDRGGTGFPGGFETLIVGRPGAREVLIRHVLIMSNADIVSKGKNDFLAFDGQDYVSCDTHY